MTPTQDLVDLTAADIMSREVITVPREMSLAVAARVLTQARISEAPVVDVDGRCIGVVSTADLVRRAQLEKRSGRKAQTVPECVYSDWQLEEHEWESRPVESVSCYMTDPVLVPRETYIGELAKMMVDAHIHRLIVAGADRRPIGIISRTDLLSAMASAPREQGEWDEERGVRQPCLLGRQGPREQSDWSNGDGSRVYRNALSH